jgi:hypothetical protein
MPSGKWYWEITVTRTVAGGVLGIGAGSAMAGTALSSLSKIYGYAPDGNKYANTTASSYGSSYTAGDIIAVKFDADTRQLEFLKNNISQGVAFTVDSGFVYFPQLHLNDTDITINFGQKPFKFPPPAGFQPLTLANTPRPTIVRPDQYVGIVTYTGNGSSERRISVGFKPDFVWIKGRTAADPNDIYHMLFDSVRGVQNRLNSNTTNSEFTESTTLSSFNPDGFTTGGNVQTNGTSKTYVAWAWKAGGNSNTFNIDDVGYATASAAGLTAGTITPTGASVNTKSGFSIITYTGTGSTGTISHGLNNTPQLIIVKSRSQSGESWFVRHSSLGYGWLVLNATNSYDNRTQIFTGTSPTSTVFSISGDSAVNNSGSTYVSYLWAEIPGFSKFGSYTGNGNTGDAGPFIHLGFKPKWIMFKCSSSSQSGNASWRIFDAVRNPYNIVAEQLQADFSDAAASGANEFDFTSNGVKIRYNSSAYNASGATYIYAAFAEAPTFNLYGAQANAR